NFLQIWIFPAVKNVAPRYDQKMFDENESMDKLRLLVSPDSRDGSLMIHQNAFISRVVAGRKTEFEYRKFSKSNGTLIFLQEGRVVVNGKAVDKRDTVLTGEHEDVKIAVSTDRSEILFIEVPMNLQ
ncbi:MAG: hypothetical protein PVF73_07495, partial [Bacteroidales bacterium]